MPFIFNTNIRRFNLLNALRLAEAAELAYQSENQIKKFLKEKWRFTGSQYLECKSTATQGFLGWDDSVILLSFRGTECIEDWITDKDVKFIEGPRGKVHRGFWQALNSVWTGVEEILSEQGKNRSLWITGHSLGGALAVLAAAKLIETSQEINGVYVFGQPRVGNQDFADYYNAWMKRRTFRFVNDEDIVSRIPPRLLGYAEVGTIRYIDRKGVLQLNNVGWKSWLNSSESVEARSALERYVELKKEYPTGISDHGMGFYIRYIKKNLPKSVQDFRDYLTKL